MIRFVTFNLILHSILLLLPVSTIAYDNNDVHPRINEEAARRSEKLDGSLKNLGYWRGIADFLNIAPSKRLFEYFRDGGKLEDEPKIRGTHPIFSYVENGLKETSLLRVS